MEEYVKGCREFSEKDFYFDHEILLEEETANFYVVMSNPEEVFGIVLEGDDWINVYADMNLSDGSVREDLLLTWCHAEEERAVLYHMNKIEKELIRLTAAEYMKKEGVMLPGRYQIFTVEFGPEYGALSIGSEGGSGCYYQEIFNMNDLKQCVCEYIDQYVNVSA